MVTRLAGQGPSQHRLHPARHKGGSMAGPGPAAWHSPQSKSPGKFVAVRHRQICGDEARLRPSPEVNPQVRNRSVDSNQHHILPSDQEAGPQRQDQAEVKLGSSPRIRVRIDEVHGQAWAQL